jgi:hypothetical protein
MKVLKIYHLGECDVLFSGLSLTLLPRVYGAHLYLSNYIMNTNPPELDEIAEIIT